MKYKILFLSALVALLAWSCKTEELMTFDKDFTYAYFNVFDGERGSRFRDSTVFNFAIVNFNDAYVDLEIPVMAAGRMLEQNTALTAILIPNNPNSMALPALPDKDIEFLPSVIEAGKVSGYLRVRLHNVGERAHTLATIKLQANDHLKNDFVVTLNNDVTTEVVNAIEWRIFFENTPGPPPLWAAYINHFTMFMGSFSQVKYDKMMEVIGFDNTFLIIREGETQATAWARTALGSSMDTFILWSRMMNHYLDWYRDTYGHELEDENGNPVRTGTTGQFYRSAGM
jgi:hypothetical protein